MKYADICMITMPGEAVEINRREAEHRLGISPDFSHELIQKCYERVIRTVDYKGVYLRTAVDLSAENICDFGFMQADSRHLYKNLAGCKEAFLLAVTAGIGIDRELARLKILSQAEYFITDALASAAVDSFCGLVDHRLRQGHSCAPRFSPGYGDLSLRLQAPFLERLNAGQLLGITLSDGYLMTPMKSITAIMGIRQ